MADEVLLGMSGGFAAEGLRSVAYRQSVLVPFTVGRESRLEMEGVILSWGGVVESVVKTVFGYMYLVWYANAASAEGSRRELLRMGARVRNLPKRSPIVVGM